MIEQIFLFKKKCQAADSKLREHLELLELNEECKINSIRLNDVSEDQDLFEVSFTKTNLATLIIDTNEVIV